MKHEAAIVVFLIFFVLILIYMQTAEEPKVLTCLTTYSDKKTQMQTRIALAAIRSFYNMNSYGQLIVVDDGSSSTHVQVLSIMSKTFGFTLIQKSANGGISKTKNVCIQACRISNSHYCFLADQDILFISKLWQHRYIQAMTSSRQKILSYNSAAKEMPNFLNLSMPPSVFNESYLYAVSWPLGAFLAIHSDVYQKINGFYNFPSKWGHEHVEYHYRAIQSGFATGFYDLKDSYTLLNLQTPLETSSTFSNTTKRSMGHMNKIAFLAKPRRSWEPIII